MGGGGSSSGKLWNCGRTDKVPLTGIVARRGAKAAGCSLLGTRPLLQRGFLLPSLNSNSGRGPS